MNLTTTNQTKPTIEAFISAFQAGVNAWESAGIILVALRQEDEHVFQRIQNQHPFITNDMLEVFWNFGKKLLYPMVALLPRHVQSHVREMQYEAQVKVCADPVEVVTRLVGDKPVVIRKPISRLTADECKRALWRKGALSVDTQLKRMQTPFKPVVYASNPKPELPKTVTRAPKEIGRYVIRRAVGGGFCLEKTTAHSAMEQRVMLHDGQALLVLTQYDDNSNP